MFYVVFKVKTKKIKESVVRYLFSKAKNIAVGISFLFYFFSFNLYSNIRYGYIKNSYRLFYSKSSTTRVQPITSIIATRYTKKTVLYI